MPNGSRRASFLATWARPGFDLQAHSLLPYNSGLSRQRKVGLTTGLLALSLVLFTFVEPLAAAILFGFGIWVIWNQNNQITKTENKLFLSALNITIVLGVIEQASVFLNATGLLILASFGHLLYVWTR